MAKLLLILLVGLVFESIGAVLLKKGITRIADVQTISASEIVRVLKAGITNGQILLGVLFEAQNRPEDAKKSYEETLAISDTAPVAANNLAYIYAQQGVNLDIALQLATSAKQRMPENGHVDDTIGWIYYKKNLPALALAPLQESLKRNPNEPVILYHLGLTYAALRNTAPARSALQRALQLQPDFPGNDLARRTLMSPCTVTMLRSR